MAKTKKQDPDVPVETPAIPVDEYHGMGGSYVIDPETGKRVRVEGQDVGADGIRPNEQPETETTETEAVNDEIK